MKLLCALALFLASFAAFAQTSPADALRGPSKKISAADLPPSYRAVVFGPSELGGFYGLAGMGSGSNEQSLMLFSLFGTVFVDPDEFASLLDGKLPRIRAYTLDLASMARTRPMDSPTALIPVFTESWIEAGRIVQWSPRPEINRESIIKVFGQPGVPNPQTDITRTLSNAKQVGLGIMLYASDYDDVFPNAQSTAQAQKEVYPYLKNADLWKSYNPNGGRLLYNTALSKLSETQIPAPAETPMVWDEKPWPDGRRVVVYTDGHGKIVSSDEWNNLIWPAELRRRLRPQERRASAKAVGEATKRKP